MAYNEIKMIVQLFEGANFQGQHVELSEPMSDLLALDFHGRAQSAKIFRGPSWSPERDSLRMVRLLSYSSGVIVAPGQPFATIDLPPGEYPNLLDLLRSAPNSGPAVTVGSVDFPVPELGVTSPERFSRIPVVVMLYEHADFSGRMRILFADEPDLEAGTGFGNVVSSVRVLAGPSFLEGLGCKLFQQVGFGGGALSFGLGDVPRLAGFTNDEVSSVQVGISVSVKDIITSPNNPN